MSFSTSPKSLIIGGSGQDGAYLAKFLLSKGYSVWISSRIGELNSFSNLLSLGINDEINIIQLDILNLDAIKKAIDRIKPDEIYNLAGQSSVGLSFDKPIETIQSISIGTLNILEAIRLLSLNTRFYNAGSSEIFGDTNSFRADELTPFRPLSPYGSAKASATRDVAIYRESYGLFACTGILFNHESPLRPEGYVTKKIVKSACRISKGSDEKLSLGNINIIRDWGYAAEYVEQMWSMLQLNTPEDFIIGTGDSRTLASLVKESFAYFDLDWNDHVVIDPSIFRASEIQVSAANPEKAEKVLGWRAKNQAIDVIKIMLMAEIKKFKI